MIRMLPYILVILIALSLQGSALAGISPGYTIHFNFVKSEEDARQWVDMAASAGGEVVSLVPPSHVWEFPSSVRCLDAAIDETKRLGMSILFSRIDACHPNGRDWLFQNALVEPARLPGGKPGPGEFCATVGNHTFEKWQRDETLYYSRKYGKLPNLAAIAVGGMVEPFVSQRGSLSIWDDRTESYEIGQYTTQGLAEWHRWLRSRFHTVGAVNNEYGTRFESIDRVPMPLNGNDGQFGHPREAYFDFVTCNNEWFLRQYRENREIWQNYSSKPFLLQLSGGATEKIALGRPEFAAFDLPGWLLDADAIGMSLYTFAGYSDWGHGHNYATLQLLAGAQEMGKPAYLMESGCEAPRTTIIPHELSFALRMGLLMHPADYIYEYFVYERGRETQPGMMVKPSGVCNEPAYGAVSRMLKGAASFPPSKSLPCFYYLSVPLTARRSAYAGNLNSAVYQVAAYLPCRMYPWRRLNRIPRNALLLLPPELEHIVSPGELKVLAECAFQSGWHIMGPAKTCLALGGTGKHRLSSEKSIHPFDIERLLAKCRSDERGAILFEKLKADSEFSRLLRGQLCEPRPGLHWLQCGGRLLLWVEDGEPVICHYAARQIEQLWCSSRNGRPVEIIFRGDAMRGSRLVVPCRQWRNLRDLKG